MLKEPNIPTNLVLGYLQGDRSGQTLQDLSQGLSTFSESLHKINPRLLTLALEHKAPEVFSCLLALNKEWGWSQVSASRNTILHLICKNTYFSQACALLFVKPRSAFQQMLLLENAEGQTPLDLYRANQHRLKFSERKSWKNFFKSLTDGLDNQCELLEQISSASSETAVRPFVQYYQGKTNANEDTRAQNDDTTGVKSPQFTEVTRGPKPLRR